VQIGLTKGSAGGSGIDIETINLVVKPLPPFRLDLTVWALRRRPDNLVDLWGGATYRRALILHGSRLVVVAVRQSGTVTSPSLDVAVTAPKMSTALAEEATDALGTTLGLNVDLAGFYELAAGDETLGPLVERFMGVKPPRFPTIFEGMANAVACQQLTLTFGIELLNRLVLAFGIHGSPEGEAPTAFPRPEEVAALEPEAFRALGFSYRKGRTLIELARTACAGNLEKLKVLDDETALRFLCAMPGLGRWSAEYVLLRALGRTNIFPGDDVGAQKNLQRLLGLPVRPDYQEVHRVLGRWHPYAGLVYFHLLLDGLERAGYLS
jgi:DNA-3-methyladenine glycosylase II